MSPATVKKAGNVYSTTYQSQLLHCSDHSSARCWSPARWFRTSPREKPGRIGWPASRLSAPASCCWSLAGWGGTWWGSSPAGWLPPLSKWSLRSGHSQSPSRSSRETVLGKNKGSLLHFSTWLPWACRSPLQSGHAPSPSCSPPWKTVLEKRTSICLCWRHSELSSHLCIMCRDQTRQSKRFLLLL